MRVKIRVDSNSTLIGTVIPVGSRNEPDNIKGISHFLEHMLFKGTKNRNMTEIKKAVDQHGATFNAWTSEEHTFFYVIIDNEHIDIGRNVIDDMIENSIFPAEELEKEKQVVLQELEMYHDNPQSAVFEIAQSQITQKESGLHIPIIGTRESVLNIDRDTLVNHYNKNYKNYLKIDIGDVFEEKNLAIFSKEKFEQEKISYSTEDYLEKRTGINQANMTVAGLFHVNNIREEMAVNIFSAVMNGFCGRFFDVIREQNNLVYTTRFYTQKHSCGTIQYFGFAGLKPKNVGFARDIMLDQLTKQITQEEFIYAKGKILGQHKLNLDNKSHIARILIDSSLDLSNYNLYLNEYEDSLNSVTLEDVNNVAKKANFESSKLVAIVPK